MRTTLRRPLLRTALLLALCSVALTGCFRIELGIRVHQDGSGVANIVLAIEDSFFRLAGEEPEVDDLFGEDEDLPPGAAVEEYRQDGFTGQRLSIAVSDMEQLPQVLAAELGEDGEAIISGLELAREGEGWHFSMTPAPLGEEMASALDGADSRSLEQVGSLLESASYTVRLALPGEITDHNADRVEGDELVWELNLISTEPPTFSARSQPAGGLSDWATLAIGIGGAAALIAAVFLLARLSRRSA